MSSQSDVHWTLETVHQETLTLPIFQDTVDITVEAEVPMSGDHRLPRRGHRYCPTLIELELSSRDFTLHSGTARDLARALIRAADKADAIDDQDTDRCGHWAPCDCGSTSQPEAPGCPERKS